MPDSKLLTKVDAALARRLAVVARVAAPAPEELAELKRLRISIQKRVEELERAHGVVASAAARLEAEYSRLASLRERASNVMAQTPPAPVMPPERAVAALRDAPNVRREVLSAASDADFSPCVIGVYFLLDGDEIVYVGQSTNAVGRVRQHATERTKTFQRWAYVACTKEELNELERFYITLLRPRDNISFKPKEAA